MNDLNDINGMYLEARASMVPNTRTIDDITGEIIELQERTQRLVLGYAVEIGRRLTEAKEMLKHGEWLPWLRDSVHFSERTAQRMMKLYDAYGAAQIGIFGAELNTTRVSDLSYTKALALIALPENERDEFADRHDLQAMSTRELEAAIKEREELKRQLNDERAASEGAAIRMSEIESSRDKFAAALAEERKKLEELRSRPVEVAVQEPDPEEMKRLIDEAVKKAEADFAAKRTELEQKAVSAENALQKAREALEAAEKKGESEIGPYKAEIDSMKAETERLRRELRASGADTARFKVWFSQVQSCWQNMQAIVVECADKETALKLKGAMDALLKSWGAA